MDEMIERVARAIAKGRGLEESARLAIDAMRKPTKKMHRAAWNSCGRGNHAIDPNPGWDEYNEKVFAAMIDEALTPPVKE